MASWSYLETSSGSPEEQVTTSDWLWEQFPFTRWSVEMCHLSKSFWGDAMVPADYTTMTCASVSKSLTAEPNSQQRQMVIVITVKFTNILHSLGSSSSSSQPCRSAECLLFILAIFAISSVHISTTSQPLCHVEQNKFCVIFFKKRQRCIADSAPGIPCRMDSSSLGVTRRLRLDSTNTMQQKR